MNLADTFPLLFKYFPVIMLCVSLVLTITIITRAYRDRVRPAIKAFLWLMISLAWWLGTAIMENTRLAAADRVIWIQIEYLGITTLPVFWFMFTRHYTEKRTWFSKKKSLLLFVIPVITLVLVFTNDIHHLIWPNLVSDLSISNGQSIQHGLWFWIHSAYSYSLLLVGNIYLFQQYIHASGINRRRTGLMVLGSFFPWVMNAGYVFGIFPNASLDPTPIAFVITGLVILWGLAHANLLNFMPVAYETIFRNINDGVIVLDEKNSIRDVNREAESIFNSRRGNMLDKKLSSFISPKSIIHETVVENEPPKTTLVFNDNSPTKYYSVLITPIADKNSVSGRLVILHDDTIRREAEARSAEKARLEAELKARQEMQQALTESSERLKALSEESPVMICNTDLNGRIIYVNKMYETVTGYQREEMLGINGFTLAFFDEKSITELKKRMQEKMAGDQSKPLEIQFITKNKTKIWLSIVAEPVREHDKPVGFQIIGQEITKRREIEEKLRKAEERYRTIFESANDIIMLTDEKGYILDINQKVNIIGGHQSTNLVGKNISQLNNVMSSSGIQTMLENFTKLQNGEDVPSFQIEMFQENGELLNIEVNAALLQDDSKVIGVLSTLRDITGRKQAEQVLRYQRELIDQMIATIPSAVAVVGEDNRLLLANETFQKTFYTPASSIGNQTLINVVPIKELELAFNNLKNTDIRDTSLDFNMTIGDKLHTFTTGIIKMQNARYLVFMNDVTEEREKQDRLYLTDRLASIGELASGVAHELNNPLTSIIGLSDMLVQDTLEQEAREDVKIINSEARRCASIVKNLVTFARKHNPKREPVQVARIINDVLNLRSYEMNSQNIAVETQFEPDLPEIMADYFQLQQVFLNIILNAESAMLEAHGRGRLKISGSKTNGNLKIAFADDGPGVLPENVGNLFTPFFTTKGVGKGTGLGLSICYGIVSSHGGKIYLDKSENQGATFIIELPLSAN